MRRYELTERDRKSVELPPVGPLGNGRCNFLFVNAVARYLHSTRNPMLIC